MEEEEEGNLVVESADLPSYFSSFSHPNFNCTIPSSSVYISQVPQLISRGGYLGRVRVVGRGRAGIRPAGVRISVIQRRGNVVARRVRPRGILRPPGPPGLPRCVGLVVPPAVVQTANLMEMLRGRLPPGCSVSVSNADTLCRRFLL